MSRKVPAIIFLLSRNTLEKSLSRTDGHLIPVKKQVHNKGGVFEQTKWVKPEDAKKMIKPGGKFQVHDKPGIRKDKVNQHFTIDRQHEEKPNHWHVTHEDGSKAVASSQHIMQHASPVEGGDAPAGELFPAAMTKGLPDKQPQKSNNKDELYKQAHEALEHFQTWLNRGKGLCSEMGIKTMKKSPDDVTDEEFDAPGGMLFFGPMKKEERAASKVNNEYDGDWSQVKDLVRATIAHDNMDEVKKVIQKLHQGGMKLTQKPKDRFAKPTEEGYRDSLLNIEFPNGHIGELQIHVKEMTKAKRIGHDPYVVCSEISRKYNKNGVVAPREEWKPVDRMAFIHAMDSAKKIYADAWQKASGQGDAMQKAEQEQGGDKYHYFEKDDAIFRARADDYPIVTHVKTKGGWKPYQGDGTSVVFFGNKITEEEALKQ